MKTYEVALFDADGVIIAPRKKFFTDRLIEEFGISHEESMLFVREQLVPSMAGKVDLRVEFPPLLKKWGIEKTVNEIFEFWWSAESEINQHALELVDQIRGEGLKTYLATDQEQHRARYIMEELGFNKHFDGAFMSFELGFQKHDDEYWKKIIDSLKTDPAKILFWDDDQKNVDRAASVGIDARLYVDFERFKREIEELV